MADAVEPATLRRFRYRAFDPVEKRWLAGEMPGEDAFAIRASLRLAGYDVAEVEELRRASSGPWQAWRDSWLRQRRISQRADIADALASLLRVGIPLDRALGDLSVSLVRGASERRMLSAVRDAVRDGDAFDVAVARHPDWFDPVDIALVQVGHRAGDLAGVLRELSIRHQGRAESGHRLLMALAYPGLLLVATLVVVAFIGTQTLPQILRVLRDAHLPAPSLTVAVAVMGQVLVMWWWALVAMGWAVVWWSRRIIGRLPVTHPVIRLLAELPWSRAARRVRVAGLAGILGQLLRKGVGLPEALETVARTLPGSPLHGTLLEAAQGVRRGEPLSNLLEPSPLLDPEFIQMLRVGEMTGEVPDMCLQIAERYERAARRSIDRLNALLEPVAVVVMAVVIGTVVMAAVLPLISLGNLV